jgi:hypothetical protein
MWLVLVMEHMLAWLLSFPFLLACVRCRGIMTTCVPCILPAAAAALPLVDTPLLPESLTAVGDAIMLRYGQYCTSLQPWLEHLLVLNSWLRCA